MERAVGVPSIVPPYLPNQGGVSLESVYSLVLAIANQQQALQLQMNQFVMMQEEQNTRVRDQLHYLVELCSGRQGACPQPAANQNGKSDITGTTNGTETEIENIATQQPSVELSNISHSNNDSNTKVVEEPTSSIPATSSNKVLPPELTQRNPQHQNQPLPSLPIKVDTVPQTKPDLKQQQPNTSTASSGQSLINKSLEAAAHIKSYQNTSQGSDVVGGNRYHPPGNKAAAGGSNRGNVTLDSTLSVDYRDLISGKIKPGAVYNAMNESNGYFTESDFSPEVREFLDDVGLT